MTNIAWGYVRVSTEEQYKSALGVRAYVANLIRYAEARGLDLGPPRQVAIGDAVIDSRERVVIEHVSASKTRFFERAGGKKIVRHLDEGAHVLFAKVDRGFRNQRDCLDTVERLRQAGVKVHFLEFGGMDIDLSQGMGQMMLSILAAFAEWEANRMSERQKQAQREARLAGRPSVNTPPIGFRFEGAGRHRRMVIDPNQMEMLRRFQGWMAEKKGLGTIYSELVRLRVPVPHRPDWSKAKYGTDWRKTSIWKYMQAAKRMSEILKDTELVPEDGKAWLDEYNRRATERDAAKTERREKRKAQVARNRLKGLTEKGGGV